MSRRDEAVDLALRRMLDADDRKNSTHGDDEWKAWQRAAADYWVLRHANASRYRRGDPDRTPSIEEFRERAGQVERAVDGVPDAWRLQPSTPEKAEYLTQIGWFHELIAGLYEPVDRAIERVRSADLAGVETLVRFLEADVYCFRSGYVKADVIRHLTRVELAPTIVMRLQRVVLGAVDWHDRREFRSYVRLARRLDDDRLRAWLHERAASGRRGTSRRARWMLTGLGESLPDEVPPVQG